MRVLVSALRCPRWQTQQPRLRAAVWLYYAHSCRGIHSQNVKIEDIRNIGIIAHVDAGKTTTTERMLYYSGVTKRIGNVDSGNTVTDFLELERERGITIQSAAITFNWPLPESGSAPKIINLIDTPGHQDFRFEVDRCLPVLDGAVCIIDSVKGVEAHTERVWAEAHKHGIPRIMFVNKLDRDGASFRRSVLDIASRLNGVPILCQIPWWDKDNFIGVINVIDRVGYKWDSDKTRAEYELKQLDTLLQSEVEVAREKLVETLAEIDEAIMNLFAEDPKKIPGQPLKDAIRRAIASGDGKIIPVFAGASLRNIGVEPLMDAIVDYLPSPLERPELEVQVASAKQSLSSLIGQNQDKHLGKSRLGSVASVFKVFNHPKEGILSFVRVYHGELLRNAHTWNTHMKISERPLGLLQVAADRMDEVAHLSTGQIGAIKGLKKARTGDTLLTNISNKAIPDSLQHIQIRPPDIPPAVAFLAIDPYGIVATKELEVALENASREDPSLRWSWNEKTEQFILQGMGKLHLEIAVHNLKTKHKQIDAEFSAIEVDYKECVTAQIGPHHVVYDKASAGKAGKVSVTVILEPLGDHHREVPSAFGTESGGNIIHIVLPDAGSVTAGINLGEAGQQLTNGAIAALARGPRRGRPIQQCHVTITLDGSMTTPTGGHFSGAANRAVRDALKDAHAKNQIGILEPVMSVHLLCPEESAGLVQHDITSAAGGQIHEIHDLSADTSLEGAVDLSKVYCPPDPYESVASLKSKKARTRMVEIAAKVPFKEMLDYDSRLRNKTAGRHSMTMVFDSFERVLGARDKTL